jgi:hypothetical protein
MYPGLTVPRSDRSAIAKSQLEVLDAGLISQPVSQIVSKRPDAIALPLPHQNQSKPAGFASGSVKPNKKRCK